MAKMTEHELLSIVGTAEQGAVIFNGEFSKDNTRLLEDYLQRPYGDEVKDQSQVISPDVQDLVESDMPSLARVFLGNRQPVQFEANTMNEAEQTEVEEKNKYVNHLIMNQPWSYQVLFNWMKDATIQKNGVVKYFIEDERKTEEVKYENVDENELSEIYGSFDSKPDVVGHSQNEDGTFNIQFKITKGKQELKIINVPTEQFLISKNAIDVHSAELVGDRVSKTRGQLLAEGFKRDLIDSLPSMSNDTGISSEQSYVRNRDKGGSDDLESINNWASQKVELRDLYILIDYDGDGIAERRHILKSGNHILINEAYDHVPYASLSCLLMPHQAIGRSRAELAQQSQRIKSVVLRQTLDNMYMVNHPRNVIHPDINIDDMLNVRPNGLIRMKANSVIPPQGAIMPLVTPYVGDKSLQMMQYLDHIRAQSTGTLMASQGLDADAISKETATRFNGIQEQGDEKIELVARTFSETGWRKLYEGVAWMVSQYQDSEAEIVVLGKQLTVNPANWKHKHHVVSKVGVGAADNDKLVGNMQGLLAIQNQLQMTGSPMIDQVKLFNTLTEITKALGFKQTDQFFNDPEQPQEMLQAENEILKRKLQEAQQILEGQANPLAEAEKVRADAALIEAQGKAGIEAAKITENVRQFDEKMAADERKHDKDLSLKLTELETKAQKDLDTEMQSNMMVFDASIGDFVASN